MSMVVQQIIVFVVVALAVFALFRQFRGLARGEPTCSKCPSCGLVEEAKRAKSSGGRVG